MALTQTSHKFDKFALTFYNRQEGRFVPPGFRAAEDELLRQGG